MSDLFLPQSNQHIFDFMQIQEFLKTQNVELQRWDAQFPLNDSDDQATILKAYAHELKPFMKQKGFVDADVINVHAGTPNVSELRQKFLKEHTHSEDEIRFFVDGSGIFWFHFNDGIIAKLTCHKGDFLSVPRGFRHWFDLAPTYFVKAIRIFSNKEGWIANYTESGIEKKFNEMKI